MQETEEPLSRVVFWLCTPTPSLLFTGLWLSCLGGMAWPRSAGGLPECFGIPIVGLHPSGYRLYPALPHRHPPVSLDTFSSRL